MDSNKDELVRNYRTVSSGCLRLLSIEALKTQVGAKWETRIDQMKFVVDSIIKRHLQRGQTFYQANDSTYVIVFDFDAESRAEHVCRAISREIVGRLLGSDEANAEDHAVEMRIASVPVDQVKGGRLPEGALEQHFANAAPQIVSRTDGDGISDLDLAESADDPTRPESGAETRSGSPESPDWRSDLLQQLQGAEAADPRRTAATNGVGEATTGRLNFRYLPFWSVGSNAFLCHRLQAEGRFGALAVGRDDFSRDAGDAELVRALDRAVLSKALRDLETALKHGRKYIVIVPLHADSLAVEADRQWILMRLEKLQEPAPKLIVLELLNGHDLRGADLTRHVWSLHRRCRRIVLRQDLNPLPWMQSQHLPSQAIGASAVVPPPAVPEREIITRMDAFADSARKYGLETFVYGLRSRSLAFAAIGSGFHHISGRSVAGPTMEIGPVTSAQMDALFESKRTSS